MNTELSNKATPEQILLNEASLVELMKMYPNLSENDVGHFLMEASAFPFCDLQYAVKQLSEYVIPSGADWEKAIKLSQEEFDRTWEDTRPERERWQKEEADREKAQIETYVKMLEENKNDNNRTV